MYRWDRIVIVTLGMINGICVFLLGCEWYQNSRGEKGPIEVMVHRIATDLEYKDKEWTVECPGIPGLPDTRVADHR